MLTQVRPTLVGQMRHYVIPARGRWLVVYRLPGVDAWEQPVTDCPTLAVAQREADRLNQEVSA